MLHTVKPKNARSKRILTAREPKLLENPKTTLFLRGTTNSLLVQSALTDLHSLQKPFSQKFQKKNPLHPFEEASHPSLEFFSRKNDASLMVFSSHSKKRPHNLTFVRFFDHAVYDMWELGIDEAGFRKMTDFKNEKCAMGLKPLMAFSGAVWENNPTYSSLKLFFMDFFAHGLRAGGGELDVEALQYIINISASEPTDTKSQPTIHFRVHLIKTKRSGSKLPRVELEEMGPRMDLKLGRVHLPNEDMVKMAMARGKGQEMKSKKNIRVDEMGDKVGRVHLGRQEVRKIQTRKMKGLKKRGREDEDEDEESGEEDDDDVEMGEADVGMEPISPKRPRIA